MSQATMHPLSPAFTIMQIIKTIFTCCLSTCRTKEAALDEIVSSVSPDLGTRSNSRGLTELLVYLFSRETVSRSSSALSDRESAVIGEN